MRPRFQADADLNQKIVTGLRRCEPAIEILSAGAGRVIGEPDPEVLKIAANAGRVLVSHDRNTMPNHFMRFVKSRPSPGIIIVPQDLDIGAAIDNLLLIWAACTSEELAGQIWFLPI